MKKLLFAGLMSMCMSAQAQIYLGLGGEAGAEQGGLSAIVGLRSGSVAVEGIYTTEKRNAEQLTDDGAGGLSTHKYTRSQHGAGAAILGLAPVGKANGIPVELVGRIERTRLRGDIEEWRTSVGAGLQYAEPKGLGVRGLVERAGDQTRLSVHLLKTF